MMAGVSCTEEDDRSPCEKAGDERRDAIEDFCEDLETVCCYCKCFNQGKFYNNDDDICTCIDPEEDTDFTCEGPSLKEAENCLDDLESCIDNSLSVAESACNMTPL